MPGAGFHAAGLSCGRAFMPGAGGRAGGLAGGLGRQTDRLGEQVLEKVEAARVVERRAGYLHGSRLHAAAGPSPGLARLSMRDKVPAGPRHESSHGVL
jgi:hypothetical protein